MQGFAEPMALCVRRRNPTRVPRRNVFVVSSDTPVLALTIYQQDTDPAPIDITTAAFVLSIYRDLDTRRGCWDYGFVAPSHPFLVAQFAGIAVDPVNGRVDIPLMASVSPWIEGRYWFDLTMSYPYDATTGIGLPYPVQPPIPNYAQGNYTILSGVMEFKPGIRIPITVVPELLGNIGIAPPETVDPGGGTTTLPGGGGGGTTTLPGGGTVTPPVVVGEVGVAATWDTSVYDDGCIYNAGTDTPSNPATPAAPAITVAPVLGVWDGSQYDDSSVYGAPHAAAPGIWDFSVYNSSSTYGPVIGVAGAWDVSVYDDGSIYS